MTSSFGRASTAVDLEHQPSSPASPTDEKRNKEKDKLKDGTTIEEREAMESEMGSLKSIEVKQLTWVSAAGLLFGECAAAEHLGRAPG
jgi:hypothetical protein